MRYHQLHRATYCSRVWLLIRWSARRDFLSELPLPELCEVISIFILTATAPALSTLHWSVITSLQGEYCVSGTQRGFTQNYLVRKLCYFSVEYHINVLDMCNARRSVVIRLTLIVLFLCRNKVFKSMCRYTLQTINCALSLRSHHPSSWNVYKIPHLQLIPCNYVLYINIFGFKLLLLFSWKKCIFQIWCLDLI